MERLKRAHQIYTERGPRSLAKKGMNFLLWDFFPNEILWRILHRSKTKKALSQSKLFTALFFYLRGSFYHEQKAILNGQAKYHQLEEERIDTEHQLIRNVHRVEKGLSMKDRRDIFAEGYIEQLVGDLIAAWKKDKNPDQQLYWSIDVLHEYFQVVEHTPTISEANDGFESFLDSIDYTPENRIPTPRHEIESDIVSYEDLKQLAEQRTSTRWFQQKEVPRELVDKALKVALESPSACNRQSYEFRLYDDPSLIDKITDLSIGVSGYQDNIPCLAVIVGKQRAYFHDRDKHVIYIDASLSAMAFQYALETLDLASCCINWPAIPQKDEEISNLLRLGDDEEVIMLMAIGYPDPDGMIPCSVKKDIGKIRSYNET